MTSNVKHTAASAPLAIKLDEQGVPFIKPRTYVPGLCISLRSVVFILVANSTINIIVHF